MLANQCMKVHYSHKYIFLYLNVHTNDVICPIHNNALVGTGLAPKCIMAACQVFITISAIDQMGLGELHAMVEGLGESG